MVTKWIGNISPQIRVQSVECGGIGVLARAHAPVEQAIRIANETISLLAIRRSVGNEHISAELKIG